MSASDRSLNKTERLFALVLLLQNRPNLSSKDLADHFEVSRRTIFRDLRTLGESGVPLTYAEGGGYEILEGYQLPPLMLTAREAATVLVGTQFTKLQPDRSLQEDAEAVSMKLRSVLPEPVRDYIDRLQEATAIAPYLQNMATATAEHDESGRWFELSEAIARKRKMRMTYYTPSRDQETRRTVDPLGLVFYSDSWNLVAFDHLRGDLRNFRLDRIRAMQMLFEEFTPPVNFDLQRYLREKGESPRNVRIVLSFDNRAYRWAKRTIPAEVEEEFKRDDRTEVTFYFENMEYLANWLLRYGANVRVLEPDTLKERLYSRAAAILAQYEHAVA